MDIGTILSVIQTLLASLNCSQLKDAWSILGYKSELGELSSVVAAVKKVLHDAEAKYDQLPQETLQYIEELRDALYDADDLLDEFVTLAKQKKLMEDHKFIKKVRLFFSRDNQFGVGYNMSHGVTNIMNNLDGIASKLNNFSLSLDNRPIMSRRREETCSFTNTEIIGRGDDIEKVVGILLDSEGKRDVSFLTIVGIGGLGKTALAQEVFNHEKIIKEFDLRLWICVSDHDQSKLDVKDILTQILEKVTRQRHYEYSLKVVVDKLRKEIAQKRFLIVLDDLWNESRDEIKRLVGHLVGGAGGSQVVVTTRSKQTAKMVGNGFTYELKGLSDENSWRLFKLMAFEQELEEMSSNDYADFINIGKEIAKTCVNVPLAIRVIGSLLYGQYDKRKWDSVLKFGIASLREDQNGIKQILKLSYHNLESPLKSCFSYCSLYPKDFKIQKDELISLWIAQGYVVPHTIGQSIYDASEEYFLILLRRCFFQDISEDKCGEIDSFKLHDLMHDIALEVADVGKGVRHVSFMKAPPTNCCFTKAHIRTYLQLSSARCGEMPIKIIVANYRCLRALDLRSRNIESLPDSIGKLIHLRYLDLSNNENMEVLPKSFTELYNLQTLNLGFCKKLKELPNDFSKLVNLMVLNLKYCWKLEELSTDFCKIVNLMVLNLNKCWKLKELPTDFCKLVNLRNLNLEDCDNLTGMPSGLGKLTNLYQLSKFVVRERNSSLKQHVELEGLKALKELRGSIDVKIHFPQSGVFVKDDNVIEGAYMKDKEHLYGVRFVCVHEENNQGPTDYEEKLLGHLQPHSNLKELRLLEYQGVRMPTWAEENNLATFLPNLVRLELDGCTELRCLVSLGKLYHLKYLTLVRLPNLEYVDVESQPTTFALHGRSNSERLPSLEELTLEKLPKLKGINSSNEPHQSSLFLSQLKRLIISDCPVLTYLPDCTNLETLDLFRFNERLRVITNSSTRCPKLREVKITDLTWLQSWLPVESLQCLASLKLSEDKKVESLSEFGQVFRACSSSLQALHIGKCPKLRSISGGLGDLTALESLTLRFLPEVKLEEIDGMPWGSLCHTLLDLRVYYCKKVESIPNWIQKLTSLQTFRVRDCTKELYERCQNPNGEDWPNIQHIPRFYIKWETDVHNRRL